MKYKKFFVVIALSIFGCIQTTFAQSCNTAQECYEKAIELLGQAQQAFEAKTAELEAQNEQLESRIKALEARLDAGTKFILSAQCPNGWRDLGTTGIAIRRTDTENSAFAASGLFLSGPVVENPNFLWLQPRLCQLMSE